MSRLIDGIAILACCAALVYCAVLHYEAIGFAGVAAATLCATAFGLFARRCLRA